MQFNIHDFYTACSVHHPDETHEKCKALYDLLSATNEKTNLTRISSKDDFWNKHVADSLLLGQAFSPISQENKTVLDVGCGGGFPSIILAIAYPNLTIVGLDSIGKKTAFVQSVADALELKNLTTFTGRARELNRKEEWQHRFDYITARAVATSPVLFRETKTMLNSSGHFLFYKTPQQIEEEFPILCKRFKDIEWTLSPILQLPANGDSRQFIFGTSRNSHQ